MIANQWQNDWMVGRQRTRLRSVALRRGRQRSEVRRQKIIRQKEGLAVYDCALNTFGLQFRVLILSSFLGDKSTNHQFQLTGLCFEKIG